MKASRWVRCFHTILRRYVADDREIAPLMVALSEAYPAMKLREGTVRMYCSGLADVPIEAIKHAMSRAVRECNFFPTIAQLRGFIEPPVDDAALLAWSGLNKAARLVGAYQSLDVEDIAAASALKAVFGSWAAFCALDDGPALGGKRNEFLAAYREAKRHTRPGQVATRLPGLSAGRQLPEGWVGRITQAGTVTSTSDAARVSVKLVGGWTKEDRLRALAQPEDLDE